MIKNLLFDLGGVIMTLDPSVALRRFEELGLKDAGKYLDTYTQAGIFGDLESGKVSADDFCTELGRLAGRKLTFAECKHAWLGYMKEVPSRNLSFLKELRKQGYHLVLVSNTNPFMMDWGLSADFDNGKASLRDYFDSLYLSYKMGVMKPAPGFFKYVIENEKLIPSESVFIDDGQRNVDSAASLGFNTLCSNNGSDWTGLLLEKLEILNK